MSSKTANDYKSNIKPSWCPGCGDYGVLTALFQSFAELEYEPDDTVLVSGIGCSSRLPYFANTYGFHSIHGRALPVATGVKAASKGAKNVVVVGGDGDGFSIGGNHFIHAARKNPNITYIVMDNEIYGLTKGQNSPTSHSDLLTKINPYESIEERINPVLMALSFDASFVARSFSSDLPQMKELIVKALNHPGFSFVHIISPCVQYNKKVTYESVKERIKKLPEDHDTKDKISGMKLAFTDDYLYTGLFYDVVKPTFEEKLENVRNKCQAQSPTGSYTIQDIMKQFA
ncbi:MAG: 2-oxoacid:ferredoxin oxidoreductase subunit beta [bacterium]